MALTICSLCKSSHLEQLAPIEEKVYFVCLTCDLTFLGSQHHLDLSEEKERYYLHENDPADENYREFLNRLMRPLIERISRGSEGLDYGAGPGPTLSVMLKEQGFETEIYDPFFSPQTDVLEKQYDFITCSETAEHFRQPHQEFQAFQRMLKPKGWLGIMTDPMVDQDQFEKWHYRTDPTHIAFYSLKTFEWIAREFNWTFEQVSKSVFLFQKKEK